MFSRIPDFIPQQYADDLLSKLPPIDKFDITRTYYDSYSNPFESKLVFKGSLPILDRVYRLMETAMLKEYESIGCMRDPFKHYYALFVYRASNNDFTRIHVDAGVHPQSKLRKFCTLVLYLTPAEIDFWSGTKCTRPDPFAYRQTATVSLKPRELIMFLNTDIAWHSVEPVKQDRIAITISGVCSEANLQAHAYVADREIWRNQRERAYFIPYPGETWPQSLVDLRNKRADPEKYHEVYRI